MVSADGSSPRARGTHPSADWIRARQQDHPRVRGEHGASGAPSASSCGSSPRARGTRYRAFSRRGPGRIIPACAGNTSRRMRHEGGGPDHPRVRGEHSTERSMRGPRDGSSPRARGTRERERSDDDTRRIIPACAGNTTSHSARRSRPSDHPRVRGEHGRLADSVATMTGSSPRARGTLNNLFGFVGHDRIIPACAGNTPPGMIPAAPETDHPRVRGEHRTQRDSGSPSCGSSPRARGTQGHHQAGQGHQRIIPACAGNTPYKAICRSMLADHPRVRGEHT